jgi:hypothetical protein
MQVSIDGYFEHYKQIPGDIEEHLETLYSYAQQCESILELGTRRLVATWAFLKARPKKMTCVDVVHPNQYGEEGQMNLLGATMICEQLGIDFEFIWADDLTLDLPDYDMIFFDTDHTYDQLSKELKIYGNRANKFLVFHDTNVEEMTRAIYEFINENLHWVIIENKENCNGLMVLGRNYD